MVGYELHEGLHYCKLAFVDNNNTSWHLQLEGCRSPVHYLLSRNTDLHSSAPTTESVHIHKTMEPMEIVLVEEGDRTSSLRTKNAAGESARSMLIDRGNSLILQAALVSVTHGDFTADGDAASLLIFEFTFIGRGSRRFTSGHITLVFDDASGDARNRPVVWAISPSGNTAINKTVSKKDVSQGFNASVNAEFAGAGAGLGYTWEASEVKENEHCAKMVGLKRVFADGGKTNGVIWILEEDKQKKGGIPSFMRTGVLLRRRDDVPFRFTISVETEVDFGGKMRRLFGFEKPEPVDPVELDEDTDLDALGIVSLNPNTPDLDLENMKDMDVGKHSNVVLATLLNIPG